MPENADWSWTFASPAAAADYPLDRLGRPRSSAMGGDGMPDAGCYEWMPDGWQSRQ